MSNDFIKISEIEMIPIVEEMGATLIKKMPNEIVFSFKGIELSIYLEREFEVYGAVTSSKSKQSIYLSELLSEYLNVEDKAVYHLSERFSMEMCIRKLVDIITAKIFPLIVNGRIIEAMNIVMSKREEGLCKYNDDLVEREAQKAFKEKRYSDVVSHYAKISELSDVQRKRLDISKGNISK